ncbi:MAG: UDP-N-acetylmuramoyl-L-alanyl-D-glutamate--2,6-diaminopimelate ligase [Methylomicrobium sp.]
MKLRELLTDCCDVGVDMEIDVAGLALDSRGVAQGVVFIALQGANQHGLRHAAQAIESGAIAIVYEPCGASEWLATIQNRVPLIPVSDLALSLGSLASRFYREPSKRLRVIGVTGTNGKTSCTQFLGQTLEQCSIIGTLGWGGWGQLHETRNTTPDALELQRILACCVDEGKRYVAMEVSSHGLAQGRVNGIDYSGAVYTNISRDHLDYHGSMERYVQAKLSLLTKPGIEFAVINLDDPYSETVLAAVPDGVKIWGSSHRGNVLPYGESVVAESVRHRLNGIEFDLIWRDERQSVCVPLFGEFNVENTLTVVTTLLASGVDFDDAVNRIERLQAVPGRMERYGGGAAPWVFVDYAHTPDALDKVLAGLRKQCEKELTVVFGCGGDRDAGKRPQMGEIAQSWADRVILTDDNPRSEAPEHIVEDIKSGCKPDKVTVIHDRALAIAYAIKGAAAGDCVLIAGKGHEEYQEIQGRKYPFSDRSVVLSVLETCGQ